MTDKKAYSKINIEHFARIDFSIYGHAALSARDSAISNLNSDTIPEIYNNYEPVQKSVVDKKSGFSEKSVPMTPTLL